MSTPPAPGPVLVMGAGSIGCHVGGSLAAAGAAVAFVGRPRVIGALREHGLTLTDLDGANHRLPPDRIALAESPDSLPVAAPSLVLLCVKSGATAEAAAALAAALPAGTVVVSLQNGVANATVASRAAPGLDIVPGMVGFNVAELAPGRFHRGTDGELAARDHPRLRAWQPWFERARLPLKLYADLAPVQWAKLLMNLNNPVNALSGLPLRAQLLDRDLRRVLAALQQEALAVMAAAGIEPARLTPLPPRLTPAVLRLPSWLFARLAARMLRIDERARSSMADDLALGRTTEIDALCGEVVRLAARHGTEAPLNRRMQALVEAWPQRGRPYSGAELLGQLGSG